MKDEHRRRRKVERALIRTLPDVGTSEMFVPVHQECLDMDCGRGFFITTQEQEFLAIASNEWRLEVYGLRNRDGTASFDVDSVSEISDDAVIPNKTRKALWRAVPRDGELQLYGDVAFLAPDVIGLVQLETTPSTVSTWDARSGQRLETVVLRGDYAYQIICRISNTEFVVGGSEGHLFCFEHEGGCNLREASRVWKAHTDTIMNISFHNGIIVTTSTDWTARLWDAETKARLAVLHHDSNVFDSAISDQYIVTRGRYGRSHWEKSELRVFRNGDGYPLMKILRTPEGIFTPTLLDGGRVLCILTSFKDERGEPLVRDTLLVIDFENDRALARLKVGCRGIVMYEVLSDGRIVAIGHGGCRGVIATLPRRFARLISRKTIEKQSKTGRRRMCTLM